MKYHLDSLWTAGLNSILESSFLPPRSFQWSQNIDNSGGIISTRQGYNAIGAREDILPDLEPKGMSIFKDKMGRVGIIIAIGAQFWVCYEPFSEDFRQMTATGFTSNDPVIFRKAYKSVNLGEDGITLTAINPYPILVAQNGIERARYWDGAAWTISVPGENGIPIGKWMQWSGNRLWVSTKNGLNASDLGNPINFTEMLRVAGGGTLFFEDDITGMGQTPDLNNLLVCTDHNTSSVKSNIFERSQWGSTPEFQNIFLPGIGCAAGKSMARQWGMTWWYSHGGLIGLDQALNTYRSSRIQYRDQEMIRSKSNLSDDISGITCAPFGNYLLVSVPSGDRYNAHTWVLNNRILEPNDSGEISAWVSVWNGIKPVELMTYVLGGRQRVFTLEREESESGVFPRVWELFTGERQDRFNDATYHPPCSLETRLLGFDENLKIFKYAELDLAEVKGNVNIQVYVASRRGGYHLILDKEIKSSVGSINSTITSQVEATVSAAAISDDTLISVNSTTGFLIGPSTFVIQDQTIPYTGLTATTFTGVVLPFDLEEGDQITQPQFYYSGTEDDPESTQVTNFIPQRRILRTKNWEIKDTDTRSCPAESNLKDNVDRGFSLLIKWTGRLAITGLRIYTDPYEAPLMGECQEDEELARSLTEEGQGEVSGTLNQFDFLDSAPLKSQYLRVITPKHNDETYLPHPFLNRGI